MAGIETPLGKLVRKRGEEGLLFRGATTEAKAVDLLTIQVDLTAGQPVRPERIQGEAMAQEFDRSGLVRAAQIDDSTAWPTLQIERPLRREGATVRMLFWIEQAIQTCGVGLGEAPGDNTECLQGLVMEALPDLSLPEPVEVFDCGLEAGFQRRSKDRRDLEGKAEAP
jgi:hypothetical protein